MILNITEDYMEINMIGEECNGQNLNNLCGSIQC